MDLLYLHSSKNQKDGKGLNFGCFTMKLDVDISADMTDMTDNVQNS